MVYSSRLNGKVIDLTEAGDRKHCAAAETLKTRIKPQQKPTALLGATTINKVMTNKELVIKNFA